MSSPKPLQTDLVLFFQRACKAQHAEHAPATEGNAQLCACVTPVELYRPSQDTDSEGVGQHVPGISFVLLQRRLVHVYRLQSHLNLSTSLQGCVFAVRTQSNSSIAPSVLSAIEEHDGQALPPNAPLTLATHVVLQHQRQPEYTMAVQQHKIIINSYWLLACVEAKRTLPVDDLLHCPFSSSKIQGASACGVSVTSFQGLQRQILLDMLWCMGVDVQKEMRLNAVSHIIARNVDDKSSKKLEHARKPEWAATISIVNCKWIYDCVRQWKILPSGPYKCNCSDDEANSWHGRISMVGKQQAASKALGNAKLALVDPSAVLISPLQGATANAVLGQLPSGTRVATAQPQQAAAVPMPIAAAVPATAVAQHVGSAQKVSKPIRSTATPSGLGTGLGTGPSSNKRQVVRNPVLLQPESAEDLAARPDRESIGGTQGAITGLTHLALQKHNQDVHLRTGSADHSAVSGLDTQQMALQVAGAEAATARLIAQMTEPSPERDDAAGHQLQQQHSSDRENVPRQQQQQYTGKRSSNVQMAAAEAVAQKQPSKRRKVSDAEGRIAASVQQAAADMDQDVTDMEEARHVLCPVADRALNNRASGELPDLRKGGEALEPEAVVGRAVQQQFEEGLFKGTVKKYNKKHKWFLIEYKDGDRQDLTWKELQPLLLPDVSVHDVEAPSAHPAKPKRKLQKVNTHTRDLQAKPTASDAPRASAAATAALPAARQAAARVGKGAKASSAAPAAAKGKAAKAASAAAGKGKRAHRHSSQHDEEAVLADEPIRTNTPAGARANAGNSPWSTSKKKAKAVLALGSMHTGDQKVYFSKLTKIGVACLSHKSCPGWKSNITHVVLPSLVRSVKSLAGMAGGCWILHADFVDACASAEAFMEPDEFEFEGGSELISAHAPRHWRERRALQGVGAFHSLQVLMYGACDTPGPAREDIATIIQSGGGTVTKCEKPCNTLTKAIARGTHLAIMSTDRTAADPGVKQLLKAQVPCASAHFVVEWLAHPEQELSDYLLFDSQIEWASGLVTAAAARVAAVKPHQMSPQI